MDLNNFCLNFGKRKSSNFEMENQIILTRICPQCKTEKQSTDFYIHKRNNRPTGKCKTCVSSYYKILNSQKKEKNKSNRRAYYIANKEKLLKQRKIYYLQNKKAIGTRIKQYNQNNKEKVTIWRRERKKIRMKTDSIYRFKMKMSNRIRDILKGKKKSSTTLKLLGCSIAEAKRHLESQFKAGMTWENHEIDGWHIDHIRPCASFDLSDPIQQKECFHYTNLQPLWAKDNLAKSDNWEPPTPILAS